MVETSWGDCHKIHNQGGEHNTMDEVGIQAQGGGEHEYVFGP